MHKVFNFFNLRFPYSMKLKPTKYLQPVFGDARCALYSIANLLNDGWVLSTYPVNSMTDHEQEIEFIEFWADKQQRAGVENNVNYIIFHAGIFNHGRLHIEDVMLPEPSEHGMYLAGLLDYRKKGADYAHTVGVLWGKGTDCVIIDPQKPTPAIFPRDVIFRLVEVVGVRYLAHREGESASFVEFSNRELSHIIWEGSVLNHQTKSCKMEVQ